MRMSADIADQVMSVVAVENEVSLQFYDRPTKDGTQYLFHFWIAHSFSWFSDFHL